jgi:transposase
MMGEEFDWFVGIDWASEAHEVRVLDASGVDVGRRSVMARGEGLKDLGDRLAELSGGRTERVAVAIELVRGPVVEALLAGGFAVFAINPKQLDRFRDRHTVAGAKDDRLDALVLADALRTDRARYRRLRPENARVVHLRELLAMDESLGEELHRLANQLRAQLERYYVEVLDLCSAADEPWVWTLLELAPTPSHAQRLGRARIAKLLQNHRIRRVKAEEVMATLRQRPLPVSAATTSAASAHVALLLARLRLADAQRRKIERDLDEAMKELADENPEGDAALLLSLPGVGRKVASTLIAEASDLLAARDYAGLRSQSGVAPVTRRSGKRCTVMMRRACSARLRRALYHWARCSTQSDPRSKAIYAAARQRGQSHGRALRGLADRLLRVLIAMLRTRSRYDPERFAKAA